MNEGLLAFPLVAAATAQPVAGPRQVVQAAVGRVIAVVAFTEELERGYLSRIQSYAGERIVSLGEGIDGPFATVKSRVVPANRRREIALDDGLHLRDGTWKVYAVLVDGASFVAADRGEFDRVIRSVGYEPLVDRLRARGAGPATAVDRLF